MPESLGDFYVWVNVPEFTLRVVKNGQVIHTERVVVGKRDTPTPIFSQDMEQVIFHPNWGVPESIKKADVLPSLIRGSTRIFTFYHLKIQRGGRDVDPATVDWSTADIRQFHVYQPPGENNVLGNIKFRFPNKHDVYMHDTPQKQLFNADVRAFSHGCMRVRNPQRLAELLLAEDQGWPAQRVAAASRQAGRRTTRSTSATRSPCTSPTSPPRWVTTASSSSSPISTTTRARSRSGWRARPISFRRRRRPSRRGHRQPRREHGAPATPRRIWSTRSLEIIDHLGRILARGALCRPTLAAAPMLPQCRHLMD